jgi:REP element-mobilizing transposase RayT
MASTLTNLLCHIVFSTKNREPNIPPSLQSELDRYIGGIIQNQGCQPLQIGGMPDHRHIVLAIRPDLSVSEVVRTIKSNSSKWINEQHETQGSFTWQAGFGAFSISSSQMDVVREYVRNQETHHRKMSFQQEYLAFLKKHEIAYDERYLWT